MAGFAHRLARGISIVGHPALLVPACALAGLARRGGPPGGALRIGGIIVALALILMGWSWLQVRRGRWNHVDASRPEERRRLTLFAIALFGAGAAAGLLVGEPFLALGLGSGAIILLLALILSPWLKLSLHVAFAMLATAIAVPLGPPVMAAVALLTLALAWSRLALGRHGPAEIAAGAVAGGVAAAALFAGLGLLAP